MADVVDIARQYIGRVKYVFGRADPDGGQSDCSGFTKVIFEKAGYKIGRTTGDVWSSDLPDVAKADLQPGDLVFFKNTYDSGYKDGVSHVGIYSGNNKFIHCSSIGVAESDLNSTYYINHYLGAKRVIGATTESSNTSAEKTGGVAQSIGLEWWGDIVVVVLAGLLILCGVVMFVLAVKDIAGGNLINA